MIKAWDDEAWEDYLYWYGNDKSMLKTINTVLLDIDRNGNDTTERPEALKAPFEGYYRRRLDGCNHLVYRLKIGRIEIIQCRSHT